MDRVVKQLTGLPLALSGLALSIATLLIVLDYSIANVSIPYIAGDLAVSADQGTYVITSFAVGNAIILPITGWLTKRIGLVRLVILSLIGFVLFSYICGASVNIQMIVFARFLQGIASGPLVPTSQSLMISIFPEEKKAKALMLWSTIVIVGPILGPILGGWISYDYSWPWIFYINLPLGLFAAFIVYTYLRPYETKIERPPTDWLGLALLAVAVSTLQFSLDKGEQYDWLNSTVIRTCLVTSVICFLYLFIWEWYHKHPALELRLLKIRTYAISILTIAINYSIYFGSIILIPLWLQEYMGYTPFWAGLAVAPLGVLPFLFSWFVAWLTKKIGYTYPLAFCNILFALSCFITAYFNTQINFADIALTRFLFGAGMTFFIVPLFGLCLRDMPEHKYPPATGFFHFVRAMFGGIGTAVFTTLWVRRSAFHHSNIVSKLLDPNLPYGAYKAKLDRMGFDTAETMEIVNLKATEQAAVLGMNDCFYLMGWIFIALIPIILLAKYKPRHEKAPITPVNTPLAE